MNPVALVTNSDERCGNAEYGRQLQAQLSKEFDVTVLKWCPEANGYAACLINYVPEVVGFSMEQVHKLQASGTKVIFILQNSFSTRHEVGPDDICVVADAVVAHQPMNIVTRSGRCNFRMIPHGIPEVCTMPYAERESPVIGTAGFALPTKKSDMAIQIALKLQGKAKIITPSHPWFDPRRMWADWKSTARERVEIIEGFFPQETVIRMLATCTMNVFWTDGRPWPGQSGAVTLALAAKRPTIVHRVPKTSSLLPYEDEIYFASSEAEAGAVAEMIWKRIQAGEEVKQPNRVLKECGWNSTGRMYRELIHEVMG